MTEPSSPKAAPVLIPRDWLVIAVLTAITIVVWIGVSIYHTFTTSTIPEPQQARMKSLPPGWDATVIDELSSRRNLSERTLDEDKRVILKSEIDQLVVEGSAGGP